MILELFFRALDESLFVLSGGIVVDKRAFVSTGSNAGSVGVGSGRAVGKKPDVPDGSVFLFAATEGDDVIVGRLTEG